MRAYLSTMMLTSRTHLMRAAAVAALLATLGACASIDPQRDTAEINRLLAERGVTATGWDRNGEPGDATTPAAWRTEPMSAQRAVQAAMLRSPRLQTEYGRLGLARADVLDAIQISNPRFIASWLPQAGGGGQQTSYGFAQPLVDILLLPVRARLGRRDYARARLEIAAAVIDVGLDVEADWYRAVAAHQVAGMRQAVADAAKTSADLAQRYFDAGNMTELQLNREKAAASQARIDAARAAVQSRLARLQLDTVVGLFGADAAWKLPEALPLPVVREDDPVALRKMAVEKNLSVLAARQAADIGESAARTTRALRLLGATTVGYESEREVDRTTIRGATLDLEVPIFNQGQAKVARADAQLRLVRARLAQLKLNAEIGVDPAAERVRVLSEVVRLYREALVPARESVARRSQEEQNFMLIGIFEVLAAKTQEYDAYQGYLEAVRDYWLARVDLTRLVGTRLPSDTQPSETAPSVAQILTPPPAPAMNMGAGMAGMSSSSEGAKAMPSMPGISPDAHDGMAGMSGMDHSGHGAVAGMPGMDHAAHGSEGMGSMPGMAGMSITPTAHRAAGRKGKAAAASSRRAPAQPAMSGTAGMQGMAGMSGMAPASAAPKAGKSKTKRSANPATADHTHPAGDRP